MRSIGIKLFVLAAINTFYCTHSISQEDITRSVFDLFHQPNQLPEIAIQFDIDKYIENKNKNEYHPAKFTWMKSKDVHMGWKIQLRPRGKYRRRICVLPPIKLRFDKSEMKEEGRKHPSIKLVTHCVEGTEGKDLIAKEQLVYELYHIITNESLRSQLINITYLNEKGRKYATNYGILIEDADQAAKDMGGEICEDCLGRKYQDFDKISFDIAALFQFMIGNGDWSYTLVRNVELVVFDTTNTLPLKLIPYDFDFCGFVNASYAIPNPDFSLTNIRQRYYMGEAESTSDIGKAIEHFKSKKEEVFNHIRAFPYLKKRSRNDLEEYVRSFYDFIEEEQSLKTIFDYNATDEE